MKAGSTKRLFIRRKHKIMAMQLLSTSKLFAESWTAFLDHSEWQWSMMMPNTPNMRTTKCVVERQQQQKNCNKHNIFHIEIGRTCEWNHPTSVGPRPACCRTTRPHAHNLRSRQCVHKSTVPHHKSTRATAIMLYMLFIWGAPMRPQWPTGTIQMGLSSFSYSAHRCTEHSFWNVNDKSVLNAQRTSQIQCAHIIKRTGNRINQEQSFTFFKRMVYNIKYCMTNGSTHHIE